MEAFVLAAFVTALSVALAGPIGFVGLVVPHITRLLVGADHRVLFPVSFVSGAAFLVLADTAARRINPGNPLPVGVVTAAIGGPFFVWLLRARRGRYFE
ncbi:MAG: FecCD family ABC transporter permease [Planctomycetota bacterium]